MFGFDFDFTLVEWLLIIIATLLFIGITSIRDYTNQLLVINSNLGGIHSELRESIEHSKLIHKSIENVYDHVREIADVADRVHPYNPSIIPDYPPKL